MPTFRQGWAVSRTGFWHCEEGVPQAIYRGMGLSSEKRSPELAASSRRLIGHFLMCFIYKILNMG